MVMSSISACEMSRCSRMGNWMFCRTVSEENSAPCWNSTPHRRSTARRASGRRPCRDPRRGSRSSLPLGDQADDGAQQHRLAAAGAADEAEDLAALPRRATDGRARSCCRSRRRDHAHEWQERGVDMASSHPDRGKEDGEQAVEHDDEEDRLDDGGRGLPAERLRAALHAQPSVQATMPMTSAMNGALIMPTSKCVTEIASLQARDEDRRAHAAVEPGGQAARRKAPPSSRERPAPATR